MAHDAQCFKCANLHPELFDAGNVGEAHSVVTADNWPNLRDDLPLFYINLQRAVHRRSRFECQRDALCLRSQRIPAVDARLHSSHSIIESAVNGNFLHASWAAVLRRNNKFGSPTFVCEVACLLSHLSALRAVIEYDSEAGKTDEPVVVAEDDVSFEYAADHWGEMTALGGARPLRSLFDLAERQERSTNSEPALLPPVVLHLALSSVNHGWLAQQDWSSASKDDEPCFVARELPMMFGAVAYALRPSTAKLVLDAFLCDDVQGAGRLRHESDWALVQRTQHLIRHLQILPPPLTVICLNDSFIHSHHNAKHVHSKQLLHQITWLRCEQCLVDAQDEARRTKRRRGIVQKSQTSDALRVRRLCRLKEHVALLRSFSVS